VLILVLLDVVLFGMFVELSGFVVGSIILWVVLFVWWDVVIVAVFVVFDVVFVLIGIFLFFDFELGWLCCMGDGFV